MLSLIRIHVILTSGRSYFPSVASADSVPFLSVIIDAIRLAWHLIYSKQLVVYLVVLCISCFVTKSTLWNLIVLVLESVSNNRTNSFRGISQIHVVVKMLMNLTFWRLRLMCTACSYCSVYFRSFAYWCNFLLKFDDHSTTNCNHLRNCATSTAKTFVSRHGCNIFPVYFQGCFTSLLVLNRSWLSRLEFESLWRH